MEHSGKRLELLGGILAALAVVPATVFLVAAVGRQLQPVRYQPAASFERITEAYAALPSPLVVLLVAVLPLLALGLAILVLWRALSDDVTLRGDLRLLGQAVARLLTHPGVVLAALALLVALGWSAILVVHAIAG